MYVIRKISKVINLIRFLSLFLIFISVSGCKEDEYSTGNGGGDPGPNEVFMRSNSFSPTSRTVAVGTTIKWVNKESVIHDVTSGTPATPSGLFSSPDLNVNGEFTFTFTQAGTFPYFCSHHAGMTGTIVVQ